MTITNKLQSTTAFGIVSETAKDLLEEALLVVVPSILQCIYVMDPATKSQIIVMSCVYLPLLNSFNMVILFLYRQKDLQRAAVLGIKWLFCKRNISSQSPMLDLDNGQIQCIMIA
ncbi:hypothetical protein DINM_004788 [Dirofilaria immitis]|nr:hypothetical protein [Dirofilaria immitis]